MQLYILLLLWLKQREVPFILVNFLNTLPFQIYSAFAKHMKVKNKSYHLGFLSLLHIPHGLSSWKTYKPQINLI